MYDFFLNLYLTYFDDLELNLINILFSTVVIKL